MDVNDCRYVGSGARANIGYRKAVERAAYITGITDLFVYYLSSALLSIIPSGNVSRLVTAIAHNATIIRFAISGRLSIFKRIY